MEDSKQVQRKKTSTSTSPAKVVFGIPLLFDRIFKNFTSRELFILYTVCKVLNDGALRLLQKRDDHTIMLSLTNLINNDPHSFISEDKQFFVRHVTLKLNMEDEWIMKLRLQDFLELYHKHILHLEVSAPDFFRQVWNMWEFPRLESLVMPGDSCDSPIPTFLAEKATVTKLSLLQHNSTWFLDGNNRLLAVTHNLQELLHKTTPNLSLLATRTLKVLELQGAERSLGSIGILNIFLRRHGPGLEKLKISFTSSYSQIPKLVFETPMSKLKELWLGGSPVQLENFGPAMFPLLESLRLKLGFLEQDSLAIQQGSFDKLTHLSVCIFRIFDDSKSSTFMELLSMCETTNNVAVWLDTGFRPWDLPNPSLESILNSLACRGVLKELKLRIQFELDIAEDGVATCTNLEVIDGRMRELRSLADKGLKRLLLCVKDSFARGRGPLLNSEQRFYIDVWGESFVSELLNLANRMKYVQVRGAQIHHAPQPRVFCPDLEEWLRAAIKENRLPLEVRWTENDMDYKDGFD